MALPVLSQRAVAPAGTTCGPDTRTPPPPSACPLAQDLSIDVYGRKAKEEAAAKVAGSKAPAPAAKAEEVEEEDDMDALLSV